MFSLWTEIPSCPMKAEQTHKKIIYFSNNNVSNLFSEILKLQTYLTILVPVQQTCSPFDHSTAQKEANIACTFQMHPSCEESGLHVFANALAFVIHSQDYFCDVWL